MANTIQLYNNQLVVISSIATVTRNLNVLIVRTIDGRELTNVYPTQQSVIDEIARIKVAIDGYLPGYSGATEETYNMQPMYGESDSPTSDPTDTSKPAFYRGRLHNTLWFWDTQELAWFPVIST